MTPHTQKFIPYATSLRRYVAMPLSTFKTSRNSLRHRPTQRFRTKKLPVELWLGNSRYPVIDIQGGNSCRSHGLAYQHECHKEHGALSLVQVRTVPRMTFNSHCNQWCVAFRCCFAWNFPRVSSAELWLLRLLANEFVGVSPNDLGGPLPSIAVHCMSICVPCLSLRHWLRLEIRSSAVNCCKHHIHPSCERSDSRLVGGWATPLKNMSQLGWLETQYMGK